jgi:ABC-type lipoprotein release transport system permease subunit
MLKEMGTDYGYRVVSIFRSAWNLPVILLSGVVASVLASATAVLPALRVIRMPITESLRFE